MSFITKIKRYKDYAIRRAIASLKSDVKGAHLGFLWWFLEPLFMMLFYFLVFQLLLKKNQTYPAAYVYTGIIIYYFFKGSVSSSITIVKQNKNIITRVYIPKDILSLSDVIQRFFKLLLTLPVVIILMIIYKVPVSFYILEVIPLFILAFIFTYSICLLFTHIGVYFLDLKKLINPILRLLLYISNVMFPFQDYLEGTGFEWISKINPIAYLIDSIRNAILYSKGCDWRYYSIWFLVSIILTALGILIIRKNENKYIKVV